MTHQFEPAHKNKLESAWRRQNMPAYQTLERFGLVTGDTMADLGCGIGYFSVPAAQIVSPPNIVYALDISVEMLAEVDKRASLAGIFNIVTVQTAQYDLKLPDQAVSFVLMVNLLHEVDDRKKILGEALRILKPGGRVAVVEWDKTQTEMGPPLDHRINKEEAIELLGASGFAVSEQLQLADLFYGILSVKRDTGRKA